MERDNDLNFLSSRAGFNTALRHFKSVTNFASEIQEGGNLADLLAESAAEGVIQKHQMRPIVNALLADKFAYSHRSHNLGRTIEDVRELIDVLKKWNNIQYVLAYYHPQNGLSVINPSNEASWENCLPLVKDEYFIIFAGAVLDELKPDVLENAVDDFITVLYGGKVPSRKGYSSAKLTQKAKEQERSPEPQPQVQAAAAERTPVSTAGKRITPKYSVVVTNELFHNGNVEAWKKIIQSYQAKYPGLDILVWYDGERINDINALFKWGKVKHGTSIQVSVAGDDIRDVSKLQRYLAEGASPRFEAFLKGQFDRILDLF